MATVTLKNDLTVNLAGKEVNVGDVAPVVTVTGKDLSDITIGNAEGTQLVIVVPSLDTPVCAAETRKFNEQVASLDNTSVVVVSMDLPFAMGRFCSTEGIENLAVGSDFRNKEFSNNYGVLLADGPLRGVTCRAIFAIRDGKICYKQLVPEITQEPDYDDVLNALK